MKHKYAELMMQYAQDAMETDKPWERWEYNDRGKNEWSSLMPQQHPRWFLECEYRRKRKTININGFKVPEPVREPLETGQKYYIPELYYEDKYRSLTWGEDGYDMRFLTIGLIHLDIKAAILHRNALLSFTQKQQQEEK